MSTPHSATLAPVNTSGSDLALPADVLSAGNGTQAAVGSGQGPFSVLHSSWAGYQSGVAAAFNFEPIIDLYYQGSVFSGSASAAAYMSDSLHYLAGGNSVPPTDCSSSIGYPCEIVGYTTTDNLLAVYGVAQVNYCTIETGYQGDPDLIQQNLDTVSKTEAAIFVQGVTEAEAACAASSPPPTQTPVHFTVAARWEKPHLTPSLHGAALKKSKVNKTVQEDSYVMVNSAPASAPAEIQYQVTLGSKKVNGLDETHNLASSDPTGWYSLPHQYKPKKAGTYTLNVRVDIGGTIETGSARLKVTK